jgi:diketogulonate reductase-like aldo/keto reductase
MRTLKGALMPAIGLVKFGSDRYSAAEVATGVAGALEVGYRHFDLGSVFGNEVEIGQVWRGHAVFRSVGEEAIDLAQIVQ